MTEEVVRLTSFTDKLQLRNESKNENNMIFKNKGVFAASRKELDFIEKQRAGSIGSIDQEIRKLKTELYHDSLRQNDLTYLEKRRHSMPQETVTKSVTASLVSHPMSATTTKRKQIVDRKQRISTKDAAEMEKQRLLWMVKHIKEIPLQNNDSNDNSSDDDEYEK